MKKFLYTFALISIASIFLSCASKDVPTDLTAAQLIQKAQTAHEKLDDKSAIYYYETLVKRYGTNLAIYVEGQYELGHLYLRTHKYEKAYPYFEEIIKIYDDTSYGDLPTAYKKLAEIGISQIPEKKLAAIKGQTSPKEETQE